MHNLHAFPSVSSIVPGNMYVSADDELWMCVGKYTEHGIRITWLISSLNDLDAGIIISSWTYDIKQKLYFSSIV